MWLGGIAALLWLHKEYRGTRPYQDPEANDVLVCPDGRVLVRRNGDARCVRRWVA